MATIFGFVFPFLYFCILPLSSLFQALGWWSMARSKKVGKNKEEKRGGGEEETPVRFVFQRSFRPLCRLIILT